MWYYFSNAVQVVPAFGAFDEIIMQAFEAKASEQYFQVVFFSRSTRCSYFRGYAFVWKLFTIVNKMRDSRRSTARIAVAEYCLGEYLEYYTFCKDNLHTVVCFLFLLFLAVRCNLTTHPCKTFILPQ